MELYAGLDEAVDVFDDVAREKQITAALTEILQKVSALRSYLSRLEVEKDHIEASKQAWKKQFELLSEKLVELCGEGASDIIKTVEQFGEHYHKDLLRSIDQLPDLKQHAAHLQQPHADRFNEKYYKDVLVDIDKYTSRLKLKKEFDDFDDEYRQDNVLATIHTSRRRTA